MRFYFSWLFPILSFLGIILAKTTSDDSWVYLGAAYIFLFHPILDSALEILFPPHRNASKNYVKIPLLAIQVSKFALYGCAFLQIGLFFYAFQSFIEKPLFGILISVGLSSGVVGMSVGHELIHREKSWEKMLGGLILMLFSYGHFIREHFLSDHDLHHSFSSALAEETLGEHLSRAIPSGFYSAFQQVGGKILFLLQMLIMLSLLFYATHLEGFLGLILGFGFIFFQSVVGIGMFEALHYLESREWECSHRWTNWTLFNLGYHTKHYKSISLPFTALHPVEQVFKMSSGYLVMFWKSLIPRLNLLKKSHHP